MPSNHDVTLGRSGLRVSPFAPGGMTFGNDLGRRSGVPEAEAVLERHLDAGGNFIDTANSYTRGHPEKIIGDIFAQPVPTFPADVDAKLGGNVPRDDTERW